MASENINNDYYKHYYDFEGKSKWKEKIWSEAFGPAYPEGLEHYGYITNEDISRFAELLDLKAGQVVLDIGCGKGGPALKLCENLDIQLLGIDIIEKAVEQARDFQSNFKLQKPALFEVGEFYNIPLDDEKVDAVVSFDSVWTAPDRKRAFSEVCRVLKPGGKFIFTNWDTLGHDSIQLYQTSDLSYVSREETEGWKTYQEKVYAGILKYKDELMAEMGEGASMLIYEAQASSPYLHNSIRRIYHMKK